MIIIVLVKVYLLLKRFHIKTIRIFKILILDAIHAFITHYTLLKIYCKIIYRNIHHKNLIY